MRSCAGCSVRPQQPAQRVGDGGVAGPVAISIPLTLLVQVPMQLAIRHVAPELRFGWRGARRRLLGQVASFSGSLIVIDSAGVVKTKTDEIVIGSALRVAAVAPYSIALVSGVGVKGVALGTLIATGLEVLVVLPFAMRRYEVAPAVVLARALGPGLVPAAPAALVLFGLRAALDPSSLVTVVLTGALGSVVCAAAYLSFGATASERIALRRAARTTWQLARARG
jgi:hypothetical protein